jgi:hypothetical protein
MPGEMDGLGLAHEVGIVRPDVKVIVTSGAVAVPDQELPEHGYFLPKPYPTERLVNMVEAKLDAEI